jgi:hypothetical protein
VTADEHTQPHAPRATTIRRAWQLRRQAMLCRHRTLHLSV